LSRLKYNGIHLQRQDYNIMINVQTL
jgi:hypothetical protein